MQLQICGDIGYVITVHDDLFETAVLSFDGHIKRPSFGSLELASYEWERAADNASGEKEEVYSYRNATSGSTRVARLGGRMFWARADGAGKPQLLTDSKSGQIPMSFARGTLAFSQLTPRGGAEIRTLQVESRSGQLRAVGDSRLFLKTSTADVQAAFSPDGHWLAYADAIDGDYQVYMRAFPDQGLRVQVSNAVGMVPRWSATGHELFYRTEDQRIMVVNYAVRGQSFTVDKPRIWSGKQLANTGTAWNYDLTPDGKRLLVLMPTASPEPRATQSHVIIVTNFFDEIRKAQSGQGK